MQENKTGLTESASHFNGPAPMETIDSGAANIATPGECAPLEEKFDALGKELRSLYDRVPFGSHTLDADGIYLNINAQELAWLGYAQDEVIGRMKFADFLKPDSQDRYHVFFSRGIRDGYVGDLEIELIGKDGNTKHVTLYANIVLGVNGDFIRHRAVLYDHTELKLAEENSRIASMVSAQLRDVHEEVKTSLAREIHDSLGTTLAVLKMDANMLANKLPMSAETLPLHGHVKSMLDLLDKAIHATRHIISGLRPTMLDDCGLLATLQWDAAQLHQRYGIECRVAYVNGEAAPGKDPDSKLGESLSINLYRIFQEALSNVVKHSGASRVDVEYRLEKHMVCLSISDNGCGIQEGHVIGAGSFGLIGMRERARQMGGEITISSQPGNGVSITVEVPLNQRNTRTGVNGA